MEAMAEGGYILILDEFQYFNRKGYEEFCSYLQGGVDRLAAKADQVRGGLIVLGSIPVGVIGLLFKRKIKETFYDLPSLGAVAIVFAILMLASEIWHRIRTRHKPEIPEDRIDWKLALWVGTWQMLALMPGASRSGCTITGALVACMLWRDCFPLPTR